jgi:hypothetical protein
MDAVTNTTTPPLPILASYFGAPCSYEAIEYPGPVLPSSTFRTEQGKVDWTVLRGVELGEVRNVQLQLRSIEDMTYDEHYNLLIEAVGVFMGDLTVRNAPKECLQITGEVRAGVTKTLTIWADGEWAIECNKNDGPLLNLVKAINYLRSIFIDIDGLGVARKEGARG